VHQARCSLPAEFGLGKVLESSGTYLHEVCSQRSLFESVVDATIYRRARIAHDAAASSLGSKVHVDGEEVAGALALLTDDLPLRNKRLAACCPCGIRRLNTTWVEAKSRAVDDFSLVQRAAWVRLVEAN